MAASTIETTKILLQSRDNKNQVLGNGSGFLGKNLMEHTPELQVTGVRKMSGRLEEGEKSYNFFIPRYRNTLSQEFGFSAGYWWQGEIGVSESHEYIKMFGFGEVQPREDNHVRVSDSRKDNFGNPVIEISYALSDNENYLMNSQIMDAKDFLASSGYDVAALRRNPYNGLSVHEVGTARMGRDPQTSVVNPLNQVWGHGNVYVVDGASFVSSGSANPTLTMMAITARACMNICRESSQVKISYEI